MSHTIESLHARIARLEAHWHLQPSPPDGTGWPTSLPVHAEDSRDALSSAEWRSIRDNAGCVAQAQDKPVADDAAVDALRVLSWGILAYSTAKEQHEKIKAGNVPGVAYMPYTEAHMQRQCSDIAAKDAALAKRHQQVKDMHAEIAALRAELAAELERREKADALFADAPGLEAAAIKYRAARARVAELEGLLRLTLPHIKYHKSHCAGPDLRGDCDCGVDLLHERIGAAIAAGKDAK